MPCSSCMSTRRWPGSCASCRRTCFFSRSAAKPPATAGSNRASRITQARRRPRRAPRQTAAAGNVAASNSPARRGATGAHLRREIIPILLRPLRQRDAFQFRFQFKIVHRVSPLAGQPAFQFSFRGEHAPRNGGFRAAQNLARPRRDSSRRKSSARSPRAAWRAVSAAPPGRLLAPFHVAGEISRVRACARKVPGTIRLELKPPRLALTPVQAGVDGDAVKPGGKFRRAAKGADLLVGADERLLREILGVRGEPVIRNVSE